MSKKIALIGSGNVLFKDEGIGLYGAKYIKENYIFEPAIEIVDGGTLGMLLVTLLYEQDEIIIMNTSSAQGGAFATVTCKSSDAFLEESTLKKTANEVETAEILQIASLASHMAQTTLVSIVPEDILSVEVGLSQSVLQAFSKYVQTALEALESLGVTVTRKKNGMGLEQILEGFSHPSVEFKRGF